MLPHANQSNKQYHLVCPTHLIQPQKTPNYISKLECIHNCISNDKTSADVGKAPRKQLASKAAKAAAPPVPLRPLSEFDSILDSQYDTNSPEGMRVYDVKTKAGNLAKDLIDNN